jgi:hypothetical protein
VIALSECRSFSSRLLEWDRKEKATLVSEFGVWRLFQSWDKNVLDLVFN